MTPQTDTAAFRSLSITQLKELLAQTEDAIADRRIEELKVLADGYAKKLAMNGFSLREGIDALKPYLRLRRSLDIIGAALMRSRYALENAALNSGSVASVSRSWMRR